MAYEDIADIMAGRNKPETAALALERWDAGKILWSVSLGGLGPGYEQTIQCAVFEIIRDFGAVFPPEIKDEADWGRATIDRVGSELGMSGAQAGAARNFAYHVLRDGWKTTVDSFEESRRIQISSFWPHLSRAEGKH